MQLQFTSGIGIGPVEFFSKKMNRTAKKIDYDSQSG
jgi:hypothetical protein